MAKSKTWIILLKGALLCISLGYISSKIYDEISSGQLIEQFSNFEDLNYTLITFATLLVVVNWGLESVKWKTLVSKIQPIKLPVAVASVLSGITVSIFTPNRVGEFGGRVFFLNKENRANGIFATLIGNLAQLMTTLVFGLAFLPLFISDIHPELIPNFNSNIIFLVLPVVILVGLFVYFRADKVIAFLQNKNGFKKWLSYVVFIKNYSFKELLLVLILSVLRYIVFVSQFYLILNSLAVELSYFEVFVCASQVYLILAIIPTFALSEIGVRGSVAILILGYLSSATIAILTASFVLWFINLAMPAIFGSYYIIRLKV